MKLSVSWLGVLLILGVILYFSWYGLNIYETFIIEERQQNKLIEAFATSPTTLSGIEISTCPAPDGNETTAFINKKGLTLCCQGKAKSDTCHGNILCSLSESSNNIPTCSSWYEAYLKNRGAARCPASMPNYFEKEDGKTMGCTSGPLKKDATGPADETNSRTCTIYPTKEDDEGQIDSCTNINLLDSTVCFKTATINSEKELISISDGALPALVSCKYGNMQDGSAGICQDDDSIVRNMLAQIKDTSKLSGWKASSPTWDPIQKLNFCSVIEKFKILKSRPFADLPGYAVFPSA